jgi:iron complex transport system permease protein
VNPHASASRITLIAGLLVIALVTVAALSLGLGYADNDAAIIWIIRAPRLGLTLLVGAGLAIAGVLLQGVFLNPLAAPSIVGVSASGAAGATVGAAFGLSFNSIPLAVVATIVSGGALLLVRALATTDKNVNSNAVLLGGIAVSFLALAIVLITTPFIDRAAGRSFSFWANGSFALATWNAVLTVVPFIVAGLVIVTLITRHLDPMSLGQQAATALGVPAARIATWALMAVVLLVAPAVSVVGIVSFVGLVVPHAMRQLIGPRHITLIPLSAIGGALLVALADLIARHVLAPIELPVGAITALIGAPVFLYLLRRMVQGRMAGAR